MTHRSCCGLLALLAVACPGVEPAPADGGVPAAEGEGEGEGESEGELLLFGKPCTEDSQCRSGLCTSIFYQGQFEDYCTAPCDSQQDCEDAEPSRRVACGNIGDVSMCILTCAEAAHCAGDICLRDYLLTGGVCYLGADDCQGERDCGVGDTCIYLEQGTELTTTCLPEAILQGRLAGQTCDPELGGFGDYCSSDTDCPGSSWCTAVDYIRNDDDTCVPPASALCENWEMCRRDGICAGPCLEDADCPAGERCGAFSRVLSAAAAAAAGSDFATVGGCFAARGSGAPCSASAECPADEGCLLYPSLPEGFAALCRAPEAGDGLVGEQCGDDPFTTNVREPDSSCAQGACLDGHCARACRDQADCDSGQQCGSTIGYGLCVGGAACTADADCAATERCRVDPAFNPVVQRCAPALGELPLGAECRIDLNPWPCARDGDCSGSEVCDRTAQRCSPAPAARCGGSCGAGHCTAPCDVDADCGDPTVFACIGVHFVQDDAFGRVAYDAYGAVVGRCLYAAGSRASCGSDAACSGGERCRPFADRDGTIRGACIVPEPSDAADGDYCSFGLGIYGGRCASGVCDVYPGDDSGTCLTTCTIDSDCPAGRPCVNVPFAEMIVGSPVGGPDVFRACRD